MANPYKKVTLKTLTQLEADGWVMQNMGAFAQMVKDNDVLMPHQFTLCGEQLEGDKVYEVPESIVDSVDEEYAVINETVTAMEDGTPLTFTVYSNFGMHYEYGSNRHYLTPAEAAGFKQFFNAVLP